MPILYLLLLILAACLSLGCQSVSQPPSQPQFASTPPPLLPVQWKTNAPSSYRVKVDDTLLDVADQFLDNPWQWQQAWQDNPTPLQPGQQVDRVEENGQQRLVLNEAIASVKLTPEVRVTHLHQAVPVLPRRYLRSFLHQSVVVTTPQWQQAPYIIGGENYRLMYGQGDEVFVAGRLPANKRYGVYRQGKEYRGLNRRPLGLAGQYVATIKAMPGRGSGYRIISSKNAVQAGDRIFALPKKASGDFFPTPAPRGLNARIIGFPEGSLHNASKYQTVVVDKGRNRRLRVGNIFAIDSRRQSLKDPITGQRHQVQFTDQVGLVMVYRVFDQVSYALVIDMSPTAIKKGDRLVSPLARR